MNEIKISIEMRIEASSESAARQYASAHGVDVRVGKWYPNHGGEGGRLYVASTTPFFGLPPVAPSPQPSPQPNPEPNLGMCGGHGLVNKFCANPVHKILHRSSNYSEWECESCGALLRTTWD